MCVKWHGIEQHTSKENMWFHSVAAFCVFIKDYLLNKMYTPHSTKSYITCVLSAKTQEITN